MNESTTSVNPAGETANNGAANEAISRLRAKRDSIVSSVQGGKRGGVRIAGPGKTIGRPPKSSFKSEPTTTATAPAAPEPARQENVNKKMGQVWRTVGYGLALGTNCNVWMLDAEQEKLLGEAYGDLCAAFGIADTLAFKIVFAVGVTVGTMGLKAAQYQAYAAALRAENDKTNKDPSRNSPKQPDNKEKETPKETPAGQVHETKPGLL